MILSVALIVMIMWTKRYGLFVMLPFFIIADILIIAFACWYDMKRELSEIDCDNDYGDNQ